MQLVPVEAKFPDLHQATVEALGDVQLEMVECALCGEFHPPELHAQRYVTPWDPTDPEEA